MFKCTFKFIWVRPHVDYAISKSLNNPLDNKCVRGLNIKMYPLYMSLRFCFNIQADTSKDLLIKVVIVRVYVVQNCPKHFSFNFSRHFIFVPLTSEIVMFYVQQLALE